MGEYVPENNPLITTSAMEKSMLNLPSRDTGAKTGSEVGRAVMGLLGQPRDDYFIGQILTGNVPDCVRNLVPVTVLAQGNTLQYYVSGDVLSVGSNEDYLRISLNGKSAKRLLDQLDSTMPTKKMCDDIWRSADLKLNPRPMGASLNMMDTPTLVNHNFYINQQIAGQPFTLLTGHKKDTCIDKHLLVDRSRTAIYGWFRQDGVAIQGPGVQASVHSWNYQDYSQAIRLVSRAATLNDQLVDLYDVLNNPQYAYLISEEGTYDASSIFT